MFNIFLQTIEKLQNSPEKNVLVKTLSLFGANLILTKYSSILCEGGFNPDTRALENGILNLLSELKTEAVTLVDAIAPPDWIINSPLGMSDGNFYKHLQSFIYQTPETFTRPNWWREILPKSKL
jgi:acyl-CoA oxidase